MKEIKKKHISFVMDDEEERAAWEKLQRMDRNIYSSCSRYISKAINAYNDKDSSHTIKVASGVIDELFAPLVEHICDAVDKAMANHTMGNGINGEHHDGENTGMHENERNQGTDSDSKEDYIDWDFLNGA